MENHCEDVQYVHITSSRSEHNTLIDSSYKAYFQMQQANTTESSSITRRHYPAYVHHRLLPET